VIILSLIAGLLSLEHNSSVNHDHGQWQDPVKSEIANHESQQEHVPSHIGKDHSSKPEVISQGSTNERLHSNTPKERDSPKVKQEPGTSTPEGIIAQQQSLHQMKSQQLPGSKQTNSSTMMKPPVVTLSFHMLIPILRRHLDKDRYASPIHFCDVTG
jgi:transcription initiation factor TFIID subunit 4